MCILLLLTRNVKRLGIGNLEHGETEREGRKWAQRPSKSAVDIVVGVIVAQGSIPNSIAVNRVAMVATTSEKGPCRVQRLVLWVST